jgi:hypothetical protein
MFKAFDLSAVNGRRTIQSSVWLSCKAVFIRVYLCPSVAKISFGRIIPGWEANFSWLFRDFVI